MRNQALNNSLSLFASAVFLELLPVHLADYQFLGFNGSVNTLFNAHDTLLRNELRLRLVQHRRARRDGEDRGDVAVERFRVD